jgi:hypothetical protein
MTDLLVQIEAEKKSRYASLEKALAAVDEIESRPIVYRKLRYVFSRIGQTLWYWKQFLIAFIIIAILTGGLSLNLPSLNFRNNNNSTINVTNIQTIVKNAPQDKDKRTKLASVYGATANAISNGTITNKDAVFVTLKTQTASVIASPDWKATIQSIDKLLSGHDTLDGIATELNNLSEALK